MTSHLELDVQRVREQAVKIITALEAADEMGFPALIRQLEVDPDQPDQYTSLAFWNLLDLSRRWTGGVMMLALVPESQQTGAFL